MRMAIEQVEASGPARWLAAAGKALLAATAALSLTACAGGGAQNEARQGGAGRSGVLQSLELQQQAEPGRGRRVEPGQRAVIALLAPVGDSRQEIRNLAQSLANAAQLAATDIRDPDLELKVYDTRGTPEGAQAAAARAADEGAALVLGPLFAQSITAAAPVAASKGLTVISFSTDSSVAGGNVFLIGFLPQTEIERVTTYAASRGLVNFGALAPQNRLGEITLQALRDAALGVGGRVLAEERYVQDFQGIEEGVKAYVDQHKSQEDLVPIQAVMLADQGQALESLAAYLAYFDVSPKDVKFFGAGGWNSPVTLKETALRGGWFAAPDPRLRQQFDQRYQQAYGSAPHPLASLGYDAMAAAGAMMADARSRSDPYPFTVEAITAPAGFAGVNGVYRFLTSGLNQRGLAVLEVGDSGFRVIDPAPTSFAGL